MLQLLVEAHGLVAADDGSVDQVTEEVALIPGSEEDQLLPHCGGGRCRGGGGGVEWGGGGGGQEGGGGGGGDGDGVACLSELHCEAAMVFEVLFEFDGGVESEAALDLHSPPQLVPGHLPACKVEDDDVRLAPAEGAQSRHPEGAAEATAGSGRGGGGAGRLHRLKGRSQAREVTGLC